MKLIKNFADTYVMTVFNASGDKRNCYEIYNVCAAGVGNAFVYHHGRQIELSQILRKEPQPILIKYLLNILLIVSSLSKQTL